MTGRVLAYTAGTALIIATIDGVSGQARVTVTGSVPPSVPAVASVTVSLAAATIEVGQATSASAVARDAAGTILPDPGITWSSTAARVATVSASTGVVTGVGAGTADIIATTAGMSGRASINVTPPPPPSPAAVTSVTVRLAESSLRVGETTAATVALRDAQGNVLTGREVSWRSSAIGVATISGAGVVTAAGAGAASIIASSEGISGSALLTVSTSPPPPPPPPPPGALAFTSDWNTARGNTPTAVRDGSKWDADYNIASPVPDRVSVIAATGLGFPGEMANVLAIRYDGNTWTGISKNNGWQLPPVGGSLYFRMYFRFGIGGTQRTPQRHHPVQACAAASSHCGQAWWKVAKPSSGETIQFVVENYGQAGGGNVTDSHIWHTTLTRNQTYRIEEQYERTAANRWRLRVRVYDSANNLVRSESDFRCGWYGHGHTLADDISFPMIDLEGLRDKFIVNQGVSLALGSSDPNANRIYYGGFAVSLSDWIGPYRFGERP